jgi:hypothetical protein
VSKNTLIAAYETLVALGCVRSHQGAGFFVSEESLRPGSRPPAHLAEAVDRIWLLREQLEQNYQVRVGDGRPPQAWMEGSELGRHLRPLDLRKRPIGEGYSSPYAAMAFGHRARNPSGPAAMCRVNRPETRPQSHLSPNFFRNFLHQGGRPNT